MAFYFVPELPESHKQFTPKQMIAEVFKQGVGKPSATIGFSGGWKHSEFLDAFKQKDNKRTKAVTLSTIKSWTKRDTSLEKYKFTLLRVATPQNVYSATGVRADFTLWRNAINECLLRYQQNAPQRRKVSKTQKQGSDFLRLLNRNTQKKIKLIDFIESVNFTADKEDTRLQLSNGLYIERTIEEEIIDLLKSGIDIPIVISGEPGTGKSSLTWSLQSKLSDEGVLNCLADINDIEQLFQLDKNNFYKINDELTSSLVELAKNRFVITVDTVDNFLTDERNSRSIINFVEQLCDLGIQVILTSRPKEVSFLQQMLLKLLTLENYTDEELPKALEKYANVYVQKKHAQNYLNQFHNAIAQLLPIAEVCKNPLALRMLFSVYAPEDINFDEVNIVSLYSEFWEKRIKQDQRSAERVFSSADADLSIETSWIAISILGQGKLQIERNFLENSFRKVSLNTNTIDILISRGILREFKTGSFYLIEFFHQTFFEHAAAYAIVILGGIQTISTLYIEFLESRGNLLLGAVLERTLVIASFSGPIYQEAIETVVEELLISGENTISAGVYVLLHLETPPATCLQKFEDSVRARSNSAINTFFSVTPNVQIKNRPYFKNTFKLIISTKLSIHFSRVINILRGYFGSDISIRKQILTETNLCDLLIEDRGNKFTQAFTDIIPLLGSMINDDPKFAKDTLYKLYSVALTNRSYHKFGLSVLDQFSQHENENSMYWFDEFETKTRTTISEKVKGHEELTSRIGSIIVKKLLVEGISFNEALEKLIDVDFASIALHGRLNALYELLKIHNDPEEISELFKLSLNFKNRLVVMSLARITWARYFQYLENLENKQFKTSVYKNIKRILGPYRSQENPERWKFVKIVSQNAPLEFEMQEIWYRPSTIQIETIWLEDNGLSHQIARGYFLKHAGATRAMKALIEEPKKYKNLISISAHNFITLSKTSLVQLPDFFITSLLHSKNNDLIKRILEYTPEEISIGEENIDLISSYIGSIHKTDHNTKAQGYRIELSLIKLGILPAPSIRKLKNRIESDKNDKVTSVLYTYFELDYVMSQIKYETDINWILTDLSHENPLTCLKGIKAINLILENEFGDPASVSVNLWKFMNSFDHSGEHLAQMTVSIKHLLKKDIEMANNLCRQVIVAANHLQKETGRVVAKSLRKIYLLLFKQLSDDERIQYLDLTPTLSRELGRMILDANRINPPQNFASHLRNILNNPDTDRHVHELISNHLRQIESQTEFEGIKNILIQIENAITNQTVNK